MRKHSLARKILLLSAVAALAASQAALAGEVAATTNPTSDEVGAMKQGGIKLQQISPQLDQRNPDAQSDNNGSNISGGSNSDKYNGSADGVRNSDAMSDAPSPEASIHKLSVSKHARKKERERAEAELAVPPQSNSFSLMNAMFGSRGKDLAKLYAERDTGYGVCGFAMSIPITLRGYVMVMRCFPSMPAADAQIRPGDLILAVDGRSTRDIPAREIWDYFTGMPGTNVELVMHRGRQAFNVTLKRMDIGRIPDLQTRAQFLTLYQRNGVSKFVQR